MTEAPRHAALVDFGAHEPLTESSWDADRARSAIVAIVAATEEAFDADELWAAHPLDEEPDKPPLRHIASLYLGAAGVIWALDALQRNGYAELRRDWAAVATTLPERHRAAPDFPGEDLVPSLWNGEAGILLVAHTLAPARWQEDRLLQAVRANAENPTFELMWGSPGTMLAAQVMLERTGGERWRTAWEDSASRLWQEWRDDLWEQELYGRRQHILGPAHGFAGNVYVLGRGDLLDDGRRDALERRTVATLERHAVRADGLAQWPPALEPSRAPRRTQWCHGAPGIVAAVASLAPSDCSLTELLLAGGELTWLAGPLRKGASLCHGTAGNGYAFLKLFARTGDELWLDRARAFAMHALEQVEGASVQYGRGRHTLWTGDPGTALYLASCVAADPAFPTLDTW